MKLSNTSRGDLAVERIAVMGIRSICCHIKLTGPRGMSSQFREADPANAGRKLNDKLPPHTRVMALEAMAQATGILLPPRLGSGCQPSSHHVNLASVF